MTDTVLSSIEVMPGYSEAVATWTTRYLDPSGFECMLSIQAESGAEALRKAQAALSHLTEAQCAPFRKDSPSGGNKVKESHSGPTILVKPNGNEKNPICPLHGLEMTKWTKDGRTWYSHRWEDGWCNGKQP